MTSRRHDSEQFRPHLRTLYRDLRPIALCRLKDWRERKREEEDDAQFPDEIDTPLDVPARTRLREWIVPPNLDRTSPLEGRSDALGRLLRIQQSVHHSRLKTVTGEMLFAFCNSDCMRFSYNILRCH